MTIAITGPQKYDLQDLVCVEIALRFEDDAGTELRIEPANGEDAELIITKIGGPRRVEIQVKGSSQPVTLSQVAQCLAHFPERKSSGCLFERLLADDRIVVLFMSGRANDAAAQLRVGFDWSIRPSDGSALTRKNAEMLLDSFGQMPPSSPRATKLEIVRQTACRDLSLKTSIPVVRDAAKRLFLVELADEQTIRSRCEHHLRVLHRIPADRVDTMIGQLVHEVKKAKQQQLDAMPLIREVLSRHRIPPLLPELYVERGQEPAWIAELSGDNVLLLSGPPRCGKSDAARWVASKFQQLGYDVQIGEDVDAAFRYLSGVEEAQRLYILDDPLGGVRLSQDAGKLLDRLGRTSAQLRPDRKLIVAQNQHLITEAFRRDTLADCDLRGHQWRDLSARDRNFVTKVWVGMAAAARVCPAITEKLTSALQSGEVTLEPGCLRHLASTSDELESAAPLSAIVHKALEDASDLGRALAEDGHAMEELLTILAIGSTPSESIRSAEIGFLGSGSDRELPGRPLESVSIGGDRSSSGPPSYEIAPVVSSKFKTCLDRLQVRRFVIETQPNEYNFSLPFYRSAAESLIRMNTGPSRERTLEIVACGLFSASAVTSRAVARSLDWLFLSNATRMECRDRLIDLAVKGLESPFPTTRDLCFGLLIRHLSEIPSERASDLPTWVERAVSISLSDVAWTDGEAYIPESRVHDGRSYFRPDMTPLAAELVALESAEHFSPERAVHILSMLRWQPEQMSVKSARRLLRFDEAIIRAEAAKLWLSIPRRNDHDAIIDIAADNHPLIARNALAGIVEGWHDCGRGRRSRLADVLARFAASPVTAIGMLDDLLAFDRVERTGDDPPWKLFTRLFPLVLKELPSNVHIDEARLFCVVRSAAAKLGRSDALTISWEWARLLERQIAASVLPGDYALGIVDVLIGGGAGDDRAELVQHLLQFPSTGALMVFVRNLVSAWSDLSLAERTAVIDLMRAERSDSKWLHAAAITASHVSSDIQDVVFGDQGLLSRPADEILARTPSAVLAASVAVQLGHQPFWYLGLQHTDGAFKAILAVIEERPNNEFFQSAFESAAGLSRDERLAEIILKCGADKAEYLFDLLLRANIGMTGFLPKAWSALMRIGTDDQRNSWYERLADAAPAIIDRLSDLRYWFKEEAHRAQVLIQLTGDVLATTLALHLIEPSPMDRTSKIEKEVSRALSIILRRNAPRVYGTYDELSSILKDAGVTWADIDALINAGRERALDQRYSHKNDARKAYESPTDWLGPS